MNLDDVMNSLVELKYFYTESNFFPSSYFDSLTMKELNLSLDWIERYLKLNEENESLEFINSFICYFLKRLNNGNITKQHIKLLYLYCEKYHDKNNKIINILEEKRNDQIRRLLIEYIVNITAKNIDINEIIFKTFKLRCDKDFKWIDKKRVLFPENIHWNALFEKLKVNNDNVELFNQEEYFICLNTLLDKIENGEVSSWGKLCNKLEKDKYLMFLDENITEYYGWKNSNNKMKLRIVEVAKKYIESYEVNEANNSYRGTDINSQLALQLLIQQCPMFLEKLEYRVWSKWIYHIINYNSWSLDDKYGEELLRLAYKKVPDLVIDKLIGEMKELDRHCGYTLRIVSQLRTLMDERIMSILYDKISYSSYNEVDMGILLGLLMEYDTSRAITFAKNIIDKMEQEFEKASVVGSVLINNGGKFGFNVIYPKIQHDVVYCNNVLNHLDKDFLDYDFLKEGILEAEQLAKLFIIIHKNIKVFKDRDYSKYRLKELGKYILSTLSDLKTVTAYEQIKLICETFPKDIKLIKTWNWIEQDYLYETWEPNSIDNIITIINNPELRTIQNGKQLQQLIIESIKEFEKE
ncbi:hypothetical protein [Clostridium sp. Marseille-Q7071]